eukprot:5205782-Prymnesium_polylepis.1
MGTEHTRAWGSSASHGLCGSLYRPCAAIVLRGGGLTVVPQPNSVWEPLLPMCCESAASLYCP